MVIIMKPNSTAEQIEDVVNAVKSHGLTPHLTQGVETTIIAAVGEFHTPTLDPFEVLDGVETVKRISQPFKLGSRQVHPENSVFPIDGFSVGGDDIAIIAGPCSVEIQVADSRNSESRSRSWSECLARRGLQTTLISLCISGSWRRRPRIHGRST